MIRFILRQTRAQNATAVTAVAIVAIIAAVTGPELVRLYQENVASCGSGAGCAAAAAAFARQDSTLRTWLGVLVVVIPAILGMFWGAPLVARELEEGTFRLAWTQSVTRARWLIVRLAVAGLASVVVAGLLSLAVTWWASPLDRAGMNQFGTFDQRDIVPAGYAAFAFMVGVLAGVLLRRTLPAMLTTLVVFTAARIAFNACVRPGLIPPVIRSLALDPASTGYGQQGFLLTLPAPNLLPNPPDIPNGWITSIGIVGKDGGALPGRELGRICPGIGNQGGGGGGAGQFGGSNGPAPQSVVTAMQHCVARVGATFHEVVSYQPASRYWPLQWYELAIFLAASVVLAGASVWLVRRIR